MNIFFTRVHHGTNLLITKNRKVHGQWVVPKKRILLLLLLISYYLFLCVHGHLSVGHKYVFLFLLFFLHICLSICLSVCLSFFLSLSLSLSFSLSLSLSLSFVSLSLFPSLSQDKEPILTFSYYSKASWRATEFLRHHQKNIQENQC